MSQPRCIVIGSPNGAGKTTFARRFLVKVGVTNFVNVDLIAAGLSPLNPPSAAVRAGKLFLAELDRLARSKTDFAFESTLSGRAYADKLGRWKAEGYRIELLFFSLPNANMAVKRVRQRVRQGGHDVPADDVLRRFQRGLVNLREVYLPLADVWAIYDNSMSTPILLEQS